MRLSRYFHQLSQSEIIRRLLLNSGYLLSATGIAAALSMVQGILTARLLGVADFGILGIIIMFTSVINKFVSFRMGELVIKYVGEYSESADDAHAAAVYKSAGLAELTASVLAYVLIWVLAPLAALLFAKNPALAGWFRLYGLIVIANLIAESSTGLLQVFDRYRQIAVMGVVQSIVTLALITLVFVEHGGMVGVLLAYLLGKTVGALGLTGAALFEAGRHWGKRWWSTSLALLQARGRELSHFAISTNISATLSLVNKDSELLWVSLFTNPQQTGYYRLALSLVNMVQLPVSPLPQVTYPELSRDVAKEDWSGFRFILRQGSILAGTYTLLVSVFLLIFGQSLIRILYTPQYLPAYPALMILLAGYLVANTFYWNRIALLALGRPDYPTKVNLISAFIKVIGIILFVPRYGYIASAALLSGFYIFSVGLASLKTRSLLQVKLTPQPASS